jgi:sodium pump decarboxylase gamma subunit
MTFLPLNLLGAMTLQEKLVDAVTVTIVGMGIVIVSLLIMGEIFKLLGYLLIHEEKPQAAAQPAAVAASASSSSSKDEQARLIAVLAAAATVAVGKRVIVRRVTFINHNTISGWSEAGRLSIQTSHNIRKNG